MKKSDWAIAIAVALCAVTLAACGSSASGGTGSGQGESVKEDASLEFAECMRAHGIEVEDPKPGKNIDVGGQNDPTTRKALTACNGKLGDSGQEVSAAEDEEINEGALAFAQCMREEGIEMGDPEILGPGKFHLDIAGLDTSSPAFVAAAEACREKLPEVNVPGVGG
jgi:predicted small secreted protein